MTHDNTRRLPLLLLVVCALLLTAPGQAFAGPGGDHREEYPEEETTPGSSGETGDDSSDAGPAGPTCTPNGPYDTCFGELACWVNDPAYAQEPSELEGQEPPTEDAHVIYRSCEDGSDEWYWSEDEDAGPSIEEQIRSARGAIEIPAFEASFNPPGRTIVNLPTWWWAEGIPDGEIRGTEALSLVAIATRRHMEVEPGDGSGSFTCEFQTSRSDECEHTYRRASVQGSERAADGSRAFPASVTVVYDLRFERDGEVVDIPEGLPQDLLTLQRSSEVPVPVREVQSRVSGIG